MNTPQARNLSPLKMLFVGLLALTLGALLNADQLVREADAKPFGRKRDISLAVWEPVQSVSDQLYLNRPRRWIDDLRGRYPEQQDAGGDAETRSTTSTTSTPHQTAETSAPVVTTTAATSTTVAATSTTVAVTSTTVAPRLNGPTPEHRLHLWVGGDSMAQVFGESLVRLAEETGLIEAETESVISSGLTRPDYFDWADRLGEVVVEQGPDVLVVIFGANDVQGIQTAGGEIFQPSDPGWADEYRSRVSATMDLIMDEQRLIIWVGQPVMRSASFSKSLEALNSIYQEEAELRDGIEFLDTWALFVDANGDYTDLLELADSRIIDLRQNDGVHLTRDGGALLGSAVLDLIDKELAGDRS